MKLVGACSDGWREEEGMVQGVVQHQHSGHDNVANHNTQNVRCVQV